MASLQRRQDQRRIRTATRSLLYGSLAATAAFGGLAAAATHHASASPAVTVTVQTPTTATTVTAEAPVQTYSPPVVQSGGS